jgi:hypothetical protein
MQPAGAHDFGDVADQLARLVEDRPLGADLAQLGRPCLICHRVTARLTPPTVAVNVLVELASVLSDDVPAPREPVVSDGRGADE